MRHIVLGVSLVILLGAALLTWLPCTKQRIGVRCWEAFWIGVQLLAVMSGAVETFEDLTDSYRVKQLCDSECCHNLHAKHANLHKLKFALALDVFVTVAHLALPVRWNIMVLFDALTMVIFSVVFSVDSGHFNGPDGHGDGLSGAVENLQAESFVWLLMLLLVGGSAMGLRQQERHERGLFEIMTDERVQRAKAEFAAQNIHPDPRATIFGRSRSSDNAANDVVSSRSAPSTTLTGRFFKQVAQRTGAARPDVLQGLLDVGVQEGWMIREAELEVDNSCILGQGSFGVVVEGRFCRTVAIKLLQTSQLDESRIAAFNELRILRHIRHPNIVHFYGACFCSTSTDVKIVMEKVLGANLHTWLAAQKPPTLHVLQGRAFIMQSLCHALVYLHSREPRVVHADLKPHNVMIQMLDSVPHPKLLDFGLSGLVTRTAVLKGGTLEYMAPEVYYYYYYH